MSHMKNRDGNKPRRQQRQAEAQVRKDLAAQRSQADRLQKLNDKLGEAFGALRERNKLAKAAPVHAEVAPAAPSAPQAAPAAPAKGKGKKKSKKAQKPA